MTDFVGAKVALLCGDRILTYQRDTRPGLPWPGLWDLPGGGREMSESAEQFSRWLNQTYAGTLDH